MDPSGTNARVIVLAGQGLHAEELAARCAGPSWDVVAYGDAYAAAVELLAGARTVLVFWPAALKPWQKPLINLACRRGIPVLACGSVSLPSAQHAGAIVVNPRDLGEFITAAVTGTLQDDQEAANSAVPPTPTAAAVKEPPPREPLEGMPELSQAGA